MDLYNFITTGGSADSAAGDSGADYVVPVDNNAASSDGTPANYLTGGDASTLRITAEDSFIFGGWVKANSLPASASMILTKGQTSNGNDTYSLTIDPTGFVYFNVAQTDPGFGLGTTSDDALVPATKAFVLAWVNAATDTVNIKINASTTSTETLESAALTDFGGDFRFLADPSSQWGLDGIIDEWFFCKNPADLAAALTLIGTTVYNSGDGIHYSELTAGNKTTLGLVSWWTMDENSGDSRTDSEGTNTLTLAGTVSKVATLIV